MFSNLSKRLFNPIKAIFFSAKSDVRDSKISLFIVVALHQIKMSNKRADLLFSLIRLIIFFAAVTAVVAMSDLIVMVRDRVCFRVNKFILKGCRINFS